MKKSPTKQGSLHYQLKQCSILREIHQSYHTFAWLDTSKNGSHLSNDEKSKLQFTEKLLRGSRQQVHVVRSDLIRWRPRENRDSQEWDCPGPMSAFHTIPTNSGIVWDALYGMLVGVCNCNHLGGMPWSVPEGIWSIPGSLDTWRMEVSVKSG